MHLHELVTSAAFKVILPFASLFCAVVSMFVASSAVAQSCSAQSPAQKLPLIELYTSQGCSSCPPADQWLGTMAQRNDVVPLSMHVNYWDYIGWKDPFAKADFSQRQRWLANVNKNSTVYTPGVFVGGGEFKDWGSGYMQQRLITRTHNTTPGATIRIEKPANLPGQWRVVAALSGEIAADNKRLFVASTKSGLVSKVNAGENHGRTLTNHQVVDFWSGGLTAKSANQFDWHASLANDPDELVAFVQDIKTGEVLQAFRMNLKRAECRG
jgi:hypothetical protein